MILRSFLPLTIGSTYKVQPGDTLARVAARLRTTVKKILEVNPDMHSAADIEVNQVPLPLPLPLSLSLWPRACLESHLGLCSECFAPMQQTCPALSRPCAVLPCLCVLTDLSTFGAGGVCHAMHRRRVQGCAL
jgi:hypothetical protein